jgi:Trypsin-co-occurring domain 1
MVQLVSFLSDAGPPLLVEVSDDSPGLERVAREDGGIVQATEKLEDALKRSMPTLRTIINSVRSLAPDQAQVEFGITLAAEAGVVVAKTAVEGHFTVTLSWSGAGTGGTDPR